MTTPPKHHNCRSVLRRTPTSRTVLTLMIQALQGSSAFWIMEAGPHGIKPHAVKCHTIAAKARFEAMRLHKRLARLES